MTGSTMKRLFALIVLFASSTQCRQYLTKYVDTNVNKTIQALENSESQILDELTAAVTLRQTEEASQAALLEQLFQLIADIETSNDQGLLDNDELDRNKAALSEVALAVENNRERIASLIKEEENLYAQQSDAADEINRRSTKGWRIILAESQLAFETVKVHRYYKACEQKMMQLEKAMTIEAQHEANISAAMMHDTLAIEQIVLHYRKLRLLEAKDNDGNYTDPEEHQRLKKQKRTELAAHATRTKGQMNVLRRKLGEAIQQRRTYEREMEAMEKERKRMEGVREWHRKNVEFAKMA